MKELFPKDFAWGAATSAYQIEGAACQDGKGESVWDVFCRQPGRVYGGHTGDVACDHYHRFDEDFSIMESLGIRNYRFSFAWPRLLPEGTGAVNQKGLEFYDRLIDSMMAHGIMPHATLFHWDYPYALFCRGGWLNDDSPGWFAEYAELLARRYGDRVKNIFTLNEPQCFIGISCFDTFHAPGIKFPVKDCLAMAHNVMLAHGKSVQAIRASAPGAAIGYAPTGRYYHPASERPYDVEAAREATFDVNEGDWTFSVAWWSDPVILGRYPQKALEQLEPLMPKIKPGDMELISQPIDVYGQNIYNSAPVKAGGSGYEVVPYGPGHAKTGFSWPVTPECLYWAPKYLYERYKLPIVITENGLSAIDTVSLDGKVHDSSRIDYIQKHLLALARAAEDGVDLLGYFHWSLLDNFEWNSGYNERFGLVYVDFQTLERTPKDSAAYYSKVVESNGGSLSGTWGDL
ncbi:MAG: GH1 family beta-glucosidase [Clostridiales bacterium]|nr:GH1 family beta-glucosidase [Clostridiales bacterium]